MLRFDLEPPLEQVADQPMAAIEALRIDAIQLTPSSRQTGIRRFRHEVVMDSSFRNTHGNVVETRADSARRVYQSRQS